MEKPKRAHYRFFVSPESISGDIFVCDDRGFIGQLKNVFRLKPGDSIEVLDNSGYEYLVKLSILSVKEVKGEVFGKRLVKNEPSARIHLYFSPIRNSNFELVLEKATELGVFAFHPIICQHTVVKALVVKDRWEKIVKEASEQSHRGRIPEIHKPQNLESALDSLSDGVSLVADEKAVNKLLKLQDGIDSINLFVGPEGGFSEDERGLFRAKGVEFISFSKTILRSETASIIGIGLISNLL